MLNLCQARLAGGPIAVPDPVGITFGSPLCDALVVCQIWTDDGSSGQDPELHDTPLQALRARSCGKY